jgi:hypothetical protein
MFWYLCFVKQPGLVVATSTSKYLQENWFNCYWLETVMSVVIVSFSAVFMSYVRNSHCCCSIWFYWGVYEQCVCMVIVWNIIWSLSGKEWPGFNSVSTVLQLITVCSVTLCTSTLTCFLVVLWFPHGCPQGPILWGLWHTSSEGVRVIWKCKRYLCLWRKKILIFV